MPRYFLLQNKSPYNQHYISNCFRSHSRLKMADCLVIRENKEGGIRNKEGIIAISDNPFFF